MTREPVTTAQAQVTQVSASQLVTPQEIPRLPYTRMVSTLSSQHHQNDNSINPDQHGSTTGTTGTSNSIVDAAIQRSSSSSIVPTPLPQNRYTTASRTQLPVVPVSTSNAASAAIPVSRLGPDATVAFNIPLSVDTSNGRHTVMTYPHFYDFLKKILQNEQEYSQSMNRVYTIGPIQQVGPKMYFNIEKNSKRHKPWHDLNASSSNVALSASSENKVRNPRLLRSRRNISVYVQYIVSFLF